MVTESLFASSGTVVPREPGGLRTIKEACIYLRLSAAKLYMLMDAGELPFLKIGKARRICQADLDGFIERLKRQVAARPPEVAA
jgi:excisionase family DNA binding protein